MGTWADLGHDYLEAYLPFYETWGRDIEVVFFESTESTRQPSAPTPWGSKRSSRSRC